MKKPPKKPELKVRADVTQQYFAAKRMERAGLLRPGTALMLYSGVTPRGTLPARSYFGRMPAQKKQTRGGGQGGAPALQSGGGGGGYTAKAVHFDGNAYLSIDALAAGTDNGTFSMVWWQKLTAYKVVDGPNSALFVVDPANSYNTWAGADAPNEAWEASFGNVANDHALHGYSGDETSVLGVWQCNIWTVKTDLAAGHKIWQVYTDGVLAGADITQDLDGAFNVEISGLPFTFAGDPYGGFLVGDIADVRIMPNVSLLDGSNQIPLATRRLFIDENGKPVDPAVATVALGTAGAVLFSGDDSTFATNQGTGGVFTLIGTLTNASSSPSD